MLPVALILESYSHCLAPVRVVTVCWLVINFFHFPAVLLSYPTTATQICKEKPAPPQHQPFAGRDKNKSNGGF